MAAMNPVLRLRNAFRSIATNDAPSDAQADEAADEAADAITSYSYSQRESDLRYAQMMAEFRRDLERQRNEFVLAVLIIVGVAVALIVALN